MSEQKIDPTKTAEIRRLMGQGGKAVEHRYGEGVQNTAEYKKAAAQRARVAGRERARETNAADETASRKKPSERLRELQSRGRGDARGSSLGM